MIPRILHFNYFWEPMPEWARDTVEEYRAMLPGWEIRVHETLPDGMPGGVVKALDWPPTYRFKSDIVRYWIIYTQGGVYVDVDTRPLRPVDRVLEHDAFISLYMNRTDIPDNFFIGGVPGHPFWQRAVERCQHPEEWKYDAVWFGAANANGCDWLKGGATVLPADFTEELGDPMEVRELKRPRGAPVVRNKRAYLKHYRVCGATEIQVPTFVRNGVPFYC